MQRVLTQWLTLPAATFGLENNYHAKGVGGGCGVGGGVYIQCSGLKQGVTLQLPSTILIIQWPLPSLVATPF